MRGFLSSLIILLTCYVGLHLPRSYLFLYVLFVVVSFLSVSSAGSIRILISESRVDPGLRLNSLLALAFSLTFVAGFLSWGFWSWADDRQDIVNALMLPTLMFLMGLQLGTFRRAFNSSLLLSYSFGGLVYTLLALLISREPWWDFGQSFRSSIAVPWGAAEVMNVRSVEQNAMPAMLLIGPAFALLLTRSSKFARVSAGALLAASLLGAHAVLALNGRLGWLALLLSLLSVIPVIIGYLGPRLAASFRNRRFIIASALSVLLVALLVSSPSQYRLLLPSTFSQGLCDERFALYGAIIESAREYPFGGKPSIEAVSACRGGLKMILSPNLHSAPRVRALRMLSYAHSVFFDIYHAIGVTPVLFLIAFLLRPLYCIGRGFLLRLSSVDWQFALRWGWVCFLCCQWLFQPLLYSDGLLYYFSFALLGLLAQEFLGDQLSDQADKR